MKYKINIVSLSMLIGFLGHYILVNPDPYPVSYFILGVDIVFLIGLLSTGD